MLLHPQLQLSASGLHHHIRAYVVAGVQSYCDSEDLYDKRSASQHRRVFFIIYAVRYWRVYLRGQDGCRVSEQALRYRFRLVLRRIFEEQSTIRER
jgi:hypothetical protein